MVDGKLINARADIDARSYLSGTQNGSTLRSFSLPHGHQDPLHPIHTPSGMKVSSS